MLDIFLHGGYLACTTLLAASALQLGLGRRRVQNRLKELEELRTTELLRQSRIVELSRLNAAHQFEVHWLTKTAEPKGLPERLFAALASVENSDEPRFAWILNDRGDVLAANSAARHMSATLAFTHRGLQQLRDATLSHKISVQREFQWVPGRFGTAPKTLFLFRCGPSTAPATFLCLSHLPDITGHEAFNQELLARLCRTLQICTAEPASEESSPTAEELDLIRDMLTLRTLTDEEFDSPWLMLEEFLSRLAMLTGFERASVYLGSSTPAPAYASTDAPSTDLQHLASGGISVSSAENGDWMNRERQLLNLDASSSADTIWMRPSSAANSPETGSPETGSTEIAEQPELRCVLLARESSAAHSVTTIILSSRHDVVQNRFKPELVKWAAQFLPQTFRKAMLRVQTEERARRDGLTHVANRQTFDLELQKAITACSANQLPCSLLILDLDHFKSINDRHGHLAGDTVLKRVASAISDAVQQTRFADRALVARYGGEEFAVLLPEISLAGARRIAEQIRTAIEKVEHPIGQNMVGQNMLQATASIGVATSPLHGNRPVELIQSADSAMYAAKHAGRNRVEIARMNATQHSQPTLPLCQLDWRTF